jgi:hypothetical protein
LPHEPSSVLKNQIEAERARLREEYTQTGISQSSYLALREQADGAIAALEHAGLGARLAALREPRGVIHAVVRLLEDPRADVVAPSNEEVYRAGLLISRLVRLTRAFARAPAAWVDALAALLSAIESGDESAGAGMAMLEFAAACRGSKVSITPSGPECCTLVLDGWRCGAAAVVVEEEGGLIEAAARAEATLRALRLPGLIIFEVGGVLPSAPRLARAANEQAAASEMRRHLDAYIEPRLEAVAGAVNTDFAFAGFFSAVLSSVVVSSGRAIYVWCPRAANLCSMRDARMSKLERLMDRLSRPVPDQD